MNYLPMHATLNPNRVVLLFIYISAAVEALTAAGAARMATNELGSSKYISGGTLISVSLVLQGVLELFFIYFVWDLHRRCRRANMCAPNIRSVFIMLYGTSSLILLRCIFRAAESFSKYRKDCYSLVGNCSNVTNNEWYLYVFEAAPMVIYTCWLNVIHPGRFLPAKSKRYLDLDGQTERLGPGWIDRRPKWVTFVDLFDVRGAMNGRDEEAEFWKRPAEWRRCLDGSFALGTASNRKKYVGDEEEGKRLEIIE